MFQYDDFPDSQLEDEDDRFLANRPHTPNSGNRGVGGRHKGQVGDDNFFHFQSLFVTNFRCHLIIDI